jgi:hypothetical protein
MPISISLQLTPDVKYSVSLTSSTGSPVDSAIITTGERGIRNTVPNTEYWSLTQAFLSALQSTTAGTLELASVPLQDPPTGFPVAGAYTTFLMPIYVIWTPMTSTPTSAMWLGNGLDGCLVGIDFSQLQPPSTTTGAWTGSMTWYLCSSSPEQPAGPVVGDTATLSYTATPRSSGALQYWFSVTLNPTAPSQG